MIVAKSPLSVLTHLVEHLELHHQLIARGWPHPQAAVLAAGGKVALVKAKRYVIHLESREHTETQVFSLAWR